MAKPSAGGNVACCRTVVLTTLAAKTRARRFLCTATKTPRVAMTTTVATTTGTPTLAGLTMVPITSTRQRRRHSRRWPTHQLANGLPASARRALSIFLRHPRTRYALRVRSEHQPQRKPAGDFPHQLTTQRRYVCTFHPAYSNHGSTSDPGTDHCTPGADVASSPQSWARVISRSSRRRWRS